MDHVYLQSIPLRNLVHTIKLAITGAASNAVVKLDRYRRRFPVMVLDMPCTLFSLRTRLLPAASVAARNLRFSPDIAHLADTVLQRMADSRSTTLFNGLHLRMELDAIDWARIMGGQHTLLELFVEVNTC